MYHPLYCSEHKTGGCAAAFERPILEYAANSSKRPRSVSIKPGYVPSEEFKDDNDEAPIEEYRSAAAAFPSGPDFAYELDEGAGYDGVQYDEEMYLL